MSEYKTHGGPNFLYWPQCHRLPWLLTIVATILTCFPAQAQFAPDNLITRSFAGRDVLRMQSTLESPPSAVCGIAKLSIVAPKPSLVDRNLVVVLYIKEYYSSPHANTAYRQAVQLPEGATRVDLEIPFVQPRSHVIWDLDLFEDGRNIENKPPSIGYNPNFNTLGNDTTYAASLGLLAQGESEAELSSAVSMIASRLHPSVNTSPGVVSTTTGVVPVPAIVQPIRAASSDWRRYVSYDLIVLTPRGVAEINQHPEVADALRTCVTAGGSLMVLSLADSTDLENVADLLYRTGAANAAGSSDQDSNPDRGKDALADGNVLTTEGFDPQTWMGTKWPKAELVSGQSAAGVEIGDETFFPRLPADVPMMESIKQHGIVQRQFGFGNVLLSDRTPDKFPTAEKAVFVDRAYPSTAFSSETDGNWFWRNLIRAVGKPPVYMFCAIVALCGAFLGPGLLALTGRLKRRSLMIFLVPVISLVASLAIILYGVLSEGFETHLRVTSVQAIDAESKLGFAWSRQNYFSGIPPREGLLFSAQSYARPVYAEVSDRGFYDSVDPRQKLTCTVHMEPEQQRWSGWLRPRQQQQLLVGNRIERVELPIALTRTGAKQLSLKNITANGLPIVVVRGEGDDYYVFKNLDAGQTVDMVAIDEAQANAKVGQLMVDYHPEVPPELGEGGSLFDFGTGARRYSMSISGDSSAYSDILNRTFRKRMSDKMSIPPFGFSVLATESNAVDIPLDGKMADSLHLIVGVRAW